MRRIGKTGWRLIPITNFLQIQKPNSCQLALAMERSISASEQNTFSPFDTFSLFHRQRARRTPCGGSDIADCQLQNNLVEPWAYLHDVLNPLAHKPSTEKLTQLLPDQWLTTNPNQRWNIAQTRPEEQKRPVLPRAITPLPRFRSSPRLSLGCHET